MQTYAVSVKMELFVCEGMKTSVNLRPDTHTYVYVSGGQKC